jgi:hypothetical protein
MYGERNPPEEPPCEDCRVDLQKENEDAVRIFFMTQSQFIMGPNGPVDINHLAVHAAMELYEIKNRRDCFKKVIRLARWSIDRINSRDGASG